MATNTSRTGGTRNPRSPKATRNQEKQRLRAERAAAALAEKRRRERRRQLLTLLGVVLAIVLIVVGGYLINAMRDDSTKVADAAPPPGSQYGLTIGPDTAPHTVVVYEDFLCPFCGEFEKSTHEELAQLATEGKVQVEYRPIVFLSNAGPYSARATLIWTIVRDRYGDDAAKKLHDLLFAHQPSEEGPFPSRDDLYALAAQAGADPDVVKKAVEDSDHVQDVADATNAAKDVGVKATPTVILDGKPFTDGRTVGDLAANLLEALQ